MPVKSTYPDFEIPNVDIWSFMFERKDRPFPEDKGTWHIIIAVTLLLVWDLN